MPERVQLRRAKGWKMPPNTVKVDRSTRWGNPFTVCETRNVEAAVGAFRVWLTVDGLDAGMPKRKQALLESLAGIRGKNLACWCKPGEPCHADVLLELANDMVSGGGTPSA